MVRWGRGGRGNTLGRSRRRRLAPYGGFIFDAFSDGANVERPSEVDDRLDHSAIGFVGRQVPDELNVDLELGDWQFLEVDEATEAGAEVIDGKATAQVGEISCKLRPDPHVSHERSLGKLEH